MNTHQRVETLLDLVGEDLVQARPYLTGHRSHPVAISLSGAINVRAFKLRFLRADEPGGRS